MSEESLRQFLAGLKNNSITDIDLSSNRVIILNKSIKYIIFIEIK